MRPRTRIEIRLALILCAAVPAFAEERGQADIAIQGYYSGGVVQQSPALTGLSAQFSEFLPNLGLLRGSVEATGYGQEFKTGENYLELAGTPFLGRRWSVTGGDFRFTPSLVSFPVTNLYTPDLGLRGARIEMDDGSTRYSVFFGRQTLLEGPRVPFRVTLPETVFGAALRRDLGRLSVGARLLRFRANPDADEGFLFPAGRRFRTAAADSMQASYTLSPNLKVFGELTASRSDERRARSFSESAGATWDSRRLTTNLYWVRQNTLYYPAAGYFTGDRTGPFGDLRVRPWTRLELFCSASRYGNNIERDARVPTYRSASVSAGATARLPLALNASVQLSSISFSSRNENEDDFRSSRNRLLTVALSRPFRRHTLRLTERRIALVAAGLPERQRSTEVEDSFQFRKLFAAGAVRWQRTEGGTSRDTLFYRGALMARLGRVALGGHAELGNDLVNRTLFATNTFTTTVGTIAVRLSSTWSAEFEAFRNTATLEPNPANAFVLGGSGAALTSVFQSFNQWTTFFRIRKHLTWGGAMPPGALDRMPGQFVPLIGSVEGHVMELGADGQSAPAAGVPVTLDDSQTVETDAQGRFRFAEVAEGPHRVTLAMRALPAEFDPGPAAEESVIVRPRGIARADLNVVRLTWFEGRVTGAGGTPVENVIVRLDPSGRYTSTDPDGRFAFHNLQQGNYRVSLDPGSFAPDVQAVGETMQPIEVGLGRQAAPLLFRVEVRKEEKPVRRIELQ